ncbi:uncharacterized protein PV06_01824 [Exophiala oligosperma]|uniref:Opi1-domain-containing protein n=1 Tax=Exophiala oligosperma TaxID=215243 RepID=A0A0D2B1U4_9EURO|nr:uncharacterized protein PV06_01824 [Exophiala oligosperma]KIW46136.1 hypothetical protein PV06_01824 [Exophiala oligosperma]
MDSQSPNPPYALPPPPFSPPLSAKRSSTDTHKPTSIDIDMMRSEERSTRAASVLSGMSAEDMEAAETLSGLHQKYHSPGHSQPAPTLVQTQTTFGSDQPEPLLRLFTSQYPLAGSLINGSLSAYKTTQSYIPGAEWTERNVGLPIAGTVARISGVEGGLRWALQPKRGSRSSTAAPQTPDVEKGWTDIAPDGTQRSSSEMAYSDTLPAYNPGDRSPPYSENQVVLQSRGQQSPANWRQQLVISTSGLGIAMSDESIRSLRYCLRWLRWANGRLGEAIQNLKNLLERWDEEVTSDEQASPMSVASLTQPSEEQRQAALLARIAALKADVLQTLKHVVGIVSNYAGGALPQNARDLVHRHLISLPQRFNLANMSDSDSSNGTNGNTSEATKSGRRVMVLAEEGLDMMTQVSRVVNDTLVSAEGWCERLGRRPTSAAAPSQIGSIDEKMDMDRDRGQADRGHSVRSETLPLIDDEKSDVHMQM